MLTDSILMGSAALLGVDSVTGIWKNKRDINIIKENETNVRQNNDVLWVNFQASVNGLLEEMKQSYGIAGYKWVQEATTERAKLKAILKIVPIEPVEPITAILLLFSILSFSTY